MLITGRLQARQEQKRHRCSLEKPLKNLSKNVDCAFFVCVKTHKNALYGIENAHEK